MTAARYAELLQSALVALNVQSPVIVGNSVGGGVALLYASRNPVRGLVLCNSAGLVEVTPIVSRICRLFEKFFAAGERQAVWFNWLYTRYYALVLPMPAAAERRRAIIAQGERLAPLLRQAWAGFGKPEADLRALAASLDAPVWVAWAVRDKVIPLRACLPAIQRLKHHKLSRYDAGHAAFLEQPDKFAEDFEQWLTWLPG